MSAAFHSFGLKGTVHGVFNSVAGIGGAVTDTVSMLSFDNAYQLRRERNKNKAMAQQGGVGQGLKQVQLRLGHFRFCCSVSSLLNGLRVRLLFRLINGAFVFFSSWVIGYSSSLKYLYGSNIVCVL